MIQPATLARLAALYDRHANALDPLSDETEQAEHEFLQSLDTLHQTEAPDSDRGEFRRAVIRQCKDWLKKNR